MNLFKKTWGIAPRKMHKDSAVKKIPFPRKLSRECIVALFSHILYGVSEQQEECLSRYTFFCSADVYDTYVCSDADEPSYFYHMFGPELSTVKISVVNTFVEDESFIAFTRENNFTTVMSTEELTYFDYLFPELVTISIKN